MIIALGLFIFTVSMIEQSCTNYVKALFCTVEVDKFF